MKLCFSIFLFLMLCFLRISFNEHSSNSKKQEAKIKFMEQEKRSLQSSITSLEAKCNQQQCEYQEMATAWSAEQGRLNLIINQSQQLIEQNNLVYQRMMMEKTELQADTRQSKEDLAKTSTLLKRNEERLNESENEIARLNDMVGKCYEDIHILEHVKQTREEELNRAQQAYREAINTNEIHATMSKQTNMRRIMKENQALKDRVERLTENVRGLTDKNKQLKLDLTHYDTAQFVANDSGIGSPGCKFGNRMQ